MKNKTSPGKIVQRENVWRPQLPVPAKHTSPGVKDRAGLFKGVKNSMYLLGFLFCLVVVINSCKVKKTTAKLTEPTEQILEIKTDFGTMYMWLYKQTPLHRANYLKLAAEGYLDSTTFHRIIANFMIQGGDPNSKDKDTTNDGDGGPSYTIPAEFVDSLKHDFGAVGAARDNNPAKASSGSQFYIVENATGYHKLDKNYTVFGKIISGMNVATTIMVQPKNPSNNRPYKDIRMDVNVVEKTLAQLKTEFNFVP